LRFGLFALRAHRGVLATGWPNERVFALRFGLFALRAHRGVLATVPLAIRSGLTLRVHPPSAKHEGLGGVLDEGVAAEGLFVQLDAEAGAGRQVEPAVAGLDRAREERGLLVAGGKLHRQRAAEGGRDVEGRGEAG